MWPTTLDMTRDECRGVLRRLELETYANIISTFRAQGGLNDVKMKLLEELRRIFHISQDRHRAEARRVANDEQLCTIAETITGPNTTHEWSREGRRSFPLLPRSAPYTALSLMANGVADIVSKENSQLPYPSETVKADTKILGTDLTKIVIKDPIAVAEEKRNLKRALTLADPMTLSIPFSKKRTISGESTNSNLNSSPHMHTNARIQQLYHNHSKTKSRNRKFKRNAASGRSKATHAPSKQLQQKSKMNESSITNNKVNLLSPKNQHTYASIPLNTSLGSLVIESKNSMEIESHVPNNWPQIATSKKDITNNLSKLNLTPISQQQPVCIYTPENVKNDKKYSTESPAGYIIADTTQVSWTTKPTVVSATLSGQRCSLKSNSGAIVNKAHPVKLQQPLVVQGNLTLSTAQGPIEMGQQGIDRKLPTVSANNKIEVNSIKTKLLTIDSASQGNEIRKLPNLSANNNLPQKCQIKDSVPIKPKIQITSQQIISPAVGSVKIPSSMQLKGVQGRKSVKIYSSSSGKMFIQADNSKSVAKLGPVLPQKNIISGLSTTGTISSIPNRFSLQKFQILPSSGSKHVPLNKQNMVFMQTNVSNTSSTGNVIVRNIPVNKTHKTIQVQKKEKILGEVPFSNLVKNQNNVIVIGTVSTEKNNDSFNLNKNLNKNNMITEDTPVDILTSPLSNLESDTTVNQIGKDSQTFEIKSPSIVQTLPSSVSDSHMGKTLQITQNLSTLNTTKLPSKIINHHPTSLETDKTVIVGTTDWEVELDQEASKTRDKMDNCIKIVQKCKDIVMTEKEMNTSEINVIDNFHDVIEEDTIDDDSANNVTTEEEGIEFDLSYGAMNEDMDENVSIEYVEETANSSDEMIEIYGDSIKIESDLDNNSRNTNLHINLNENIDQETGSEDDNCLVEYDQTIESYDKKLINIVDNTSNGKTEFDLNASLDTVMFEMQEIDENGLSQIRNVTLEELMATGQIADDVDRALRETNSTKCISE